MTYTCAIVEDEPLAEKMLRKYVSRVSFLEVSWSCTYAEEAVRLLEQTEVDILFLDLQDALINPDSSFWHLVTHHKHVVVTSPYPAEALDVPLPVMAFLHKPIPFVHFITALEKFLVSAGT
jgi:response regulator of citrate/malate metabolism